LRYDPNNGRALCSPCHRKRRGEALSQIKAAKAAGTYDRELQKRIFVEIACPNCEKDFTPTCAQQAFCNIKCQRNKYMREFKKKRKEKTRLLLLQNSIQVVKELP
jgi:hypothetical protein